MLEFAYNHPVSVVIIVAMICYTLISLFRGSDWGE